MAFETRFKLTLDSKTVDNQPDQEVYLRSLIERKMYLCTSNGAVFYIDSP